VGAYFGQVCDGVKPIFTWRDARAQSGTGTPDLSGRPHARFDELVSSHKLKGCGTPGAAAFKRMILLPELDVEQDDYAHHNQA
jgi:hypothetical protein